MPANTNGLLSALAQVNKVNILLTIDLDQFNQPFSVEEPTDAQPADQVFQKVVGSAMSQAVATPAATPSELPTLTPKQKLQLQKFKNRGY